MKTIYFVRHGEAQANADGLLAGARTDSPLTAKGEQQAHEFALQLSGKKIDFIVTSPLTRAAKTADIIGDDIGYKGVIETNSLLIERDFGTATNMPKAEGFAALDNGTARDVEPVAAFGDRARQALEWLNTLGADTILVVSHASMGQMIGTLMEGGDPKDFLAFKSLANAGLYQFTLEAS